jgi:hypothetical protein
MHVSIVGPGALGRAYAAVLHQAGCRITWVARSAGAEPRVECERIGIGSRHFEFTGDVQLSVPSCDLVLVTLRAEDVSEQLVRELANKARAPIVVFSPFVSKAKSDLWQSSPDLLAATPALVADWHPPRLRYWVPPTAVTWIDDKGKHLPSVQELVRCLRHAGVASRFRERVWEYNRLTTVLFFPLQQALLLRPDVRSWRGDSAWLRQVATGFGRSRQLLDETSQLDLNLRLLAWALKLPLLLHLAVWVVPTLSPRLLAFVQEHFGHKLRAQTAGFAAELAAEASARSWPPRAISEMLLEGR